MKYARALSLVIILIAILSLFANGIKSVVKDPKSFGVFASPLKKFIDFPSTIASAFTEVSRLPTYVEVDTSFKEVNSLDYDLFMMNSHFDSDNLKWIITLSNLRDNHVLHEWFLNEDNFVFTYSNFRNSDIKGPILLSDRSVIAMTDESENLYRLDSNSNIIWHNTDRHFHHSLNLASDGNIWICTRDLAYTHMPDGKMAEFRDNSIAKIDIETGKMLYEKSITEMLMENGYTYLIHGYGNTTNVPAADDPYHLNDIEPALTDGQYWDKGDLFLSIRHRSAIIQYRPSSNKIIRLINGPFIYQHDVDITSDSTISLFNNNVSAMWKFYPNEKEQSIIDEGKKLGRLKSAELVEYNFSDSTFTFPMLNLFQEEAIYTGSQGLHSMLSNGDIFVESQNPGKVYVLGENGVKLRSYVNPKIDGYTERAHWIRTYENVDF